MRRFYPSRAGFVDSDFVETAPAGPYSAPMNRFPRRIAASMLAAAASWIPFIASGNPVAQTVRFADDRIACEVSAPPGTDLGPVLAALPIAMKSALELVGAPEAPAQLALEVLPPPSFYKRLKALFRVDAFAMQTGDEIRLYPGHDPLKLAFRLGHELTHWLVCKRHPARPPLWLDEGLAQQGGSAAAEVRARTLKQDLARPLPEQLAGNLFTLEELTGLRDYPRRAARSAAFYWQAEALANALRRRLGPGEFQAFIGLVSVPQPPDWRVLLRERWYFSDWDMDWLAGQIQPAAGRKQP